LKKQMLNILKILFFLGIGFLLVWLALRGKTEEEKHQIVESIRQSNYWWIGVSLLASLLSHYFRAVRWRLLLAPLGYRTKTSNTFFAVMVGYLANFAIYRMGEVTRCGLLTKYEKVPFTIAFGSVIAERALDMICLIILFFAILGIEFDRIVGIANHFIFDPLFKLLHSLMAKQLFVIGGGIVLVLVLLAFFYFRKKIQALISGKAKGFIKGLWDGLVSIKNIDKPVLFIAHTILIWLMYILVVYTCFFAFAETSHLSFMVAVVIVVFGSLGVIASPGGTGAYQIIVINILTTVYLVGEIPSNAFAWAVWTAQFALILIIGLLSLIFLAILNKEVKE
jgi:uncharacterized protein (TIRG00374 family)